MKKNIQWSVLSILISTSCVVNAESFRVLTNSEVVAAKENTAEIKVVKDLDANVKPFVYYSLTKGEVVSAENAKTTQWDIAFSRTTVAINGGTSGPGKGGALVLEQPFDKVADAKGEFKTDGEGGYAVPGGSGNSWYTYDMRVHAILPITGRTILIRTAEGKLAKLEIISYYKGAPEEVPTEESSFFTFRYSIAGEDGKF